MSTLTFRDSLAKFKQQYAAMRTKTAKGKTLDSICQTYGCSRKYLNKLLRGKRVYRPHRGRGPSYGEEERKLLGRLWAAAGRPCPEYLKTMLARTASDYSALGNEVRADALQKLFIEFYKRHYMRNRIVWGYVTMLWKSPDSWKRFMLSLGSFISFARSNKRWQEEKS